MLKYLTNCREIRSSFLKSFFCVCVWISLGPKEENLKPSPRSLHFLKDKTEVGVIRVFVTL